MSEPYQRQPKDDHHPSNVLTIRSQKIFDKVENAGSKITYQSIS